MAPGAPCRGAALDHSTEVAASRFACCGAPQAIPSPLPASSLGDWGRDLCPFSCQRA